MLIGMLMMAGCYNPGNNSNSLPYLGPLQVDRSGGEADSQYYTVPEFALINQDSQLVTPATFQDNIYITDFFFTSCPSICPKMKKQMLRVYNEFEDNDTVKILSHTIDPKHDTVEVLRAYAKKLGVEASKWHFVTGERKEIYDLGAKYFISVREDSTVEGGFDHGPYFALIDKDRHIRGYYDGTVEDEVDELMADIRVLLREYR